MRDLILGTAGHIDHGKTTLVRALTGIDCDRLPEEKARGMTIDIGFAHLELGEYRLGIVDVPGHERFIRNMLAGATGIDLCLLVVAADDAVMPQTREHLDIVRLLNLSCGVVALTKADLCDEALLNLAEDDVRSLVAGTFLADAPIVRVSSKTGMGLDALRAALSAACARVTVRDELDLFRLAIDRAFVVEGRGTVVTGTVASGSCRVGDEVVWLPRGELVRIRGAQSHGRPVEEAHRGMRAAFNVANVKHDEIVRGHELATPGFLVPSRSITIDLRVLAGSPQPLKHRTPVRVHIGAAEVMGTVSLLDAARLSPGETGLAQLKLAEPYAAAWGQPLVLREASANWTYGGGRVLQPVARPIRRRKPAILAALASLATSDAAERILAAVRLASLGGVEDCALASAVGVSSVAAHAIAAELVAEGKLERITLARGRHVLLHAERIESALRRAKHVVQLSHDAAPWLRRLDRAQVESQIEPTAPRELVRMLVDRLIETGQLTGDGRRLAAADHVARLTSAQQQLKDSIAAAFAQAGLQRRLHVSDLKKQAGSQAAFVDPLIEMLVEERKLVHIEYDLFIAAEAERRLREMAASRLRPGQGYRLGEIRELVGSVRQLMLPLCGYLERLGILRREGDLRFIEPPPVESLPISGEELTISDAAGP